VAEAIARDNEFDVIHAHDWLTYPAGIAAKRVSGKPLIIHVHATDFDRSGGRVNPQVYAMEKEGMDAADQIITVSNLTRNMVIEKYFINPEKVTTIYNAVEPVSQEEKIRLKKGVDEKIVTFLGRITMQKGPEYFVEAANLVLQKMKNVRFVMAGSGDMMNSMIKRVAELKISDRFHFTGFLKGDDVFDMFKMSDVFVMPSVSEPFGIVPLEAMQSDVPVIISYQSGVSEILNYAIKIDYWDTYAMADAIFGLLNYPSLHNMFKKYGKEEVDNLQWKNSAAQVREIYLQVLKVYSEKSEHALK
jgi:glycosyltransferase involved in cell wall biosynthesis